MNSPSPNTFLRCSGSAIAAAFISAPECSNAVAGTQEGSMNNMSSAVRSAADIM